MNEVEALKRLAALALQVKDRAYRVDESEKIMREFLDGLRLLKSEYKEINTHGR